MITIKTDLRPRFGPARDQGRRPTCLAFAASDTHAGIRESWEPLSCEFAFYHAQRRGKRPSSVGATLPHMLDALRIDGQPGEEGWPYLHAAPADPSAWQPPIDVGPLFGRNGAGTDASIERIRSNLDSGVPVMMLMTLSESFFRPSEGIVRSRPGETPQAAVRHAVIAVAHGEVGCEPAILVRNSWGPGWGLAGHAWLTDEFVTPRLFSVAILTDQTNVSAYSAAA